MAAPAPQTYYLSPGIVPAAGGRVVQLVGRDLDGPSITATVGGSAVSNIATDSRFLAQFNAPAHTAGKVNVVVTTVDGTATLTGAITYV